VEALAQSEVKKDTLSYKKGESKDGKDGGENTIWDWFTQGSRKNEISHYESCQVVEEEISQLPELEAGANVELDINGVPVGANANLSTGTYYSGARVTYTGTTIWCETGGNINCTSKDCND